jgi:hypothetical protein
MAAVTSVALGAFLGETGTSHGQTKPSGLVIDGNITTMGYGLADGSGQKACSVFVGGVNAWRSTIVVPNSWTVKACKSYETQTGANNYQLICITKDAIYLAPKNKAQDPAGFDCGWTAGSN